MLELVISTITTAQLEWGWGRGRASSSRSRWPIANGIAAPPSPRPDCRHQPTAAPPPRMCLVSCTKVGAPPGGTPVRTRPHLHCQYPRPPQCSHQAQSPRSHSAPPSMPGTPYVSNPSGHQCACGHLWRSLLNDKVPASSLATDQVPALSYVAMWASHLTKARSCTEHCCMTGAVHGLHCTNTFAIDLHDVDHTSVTFDFANASTPKTQHFMHDQ
ncbi:hypothetical protein V8C86DRAFT_2859270 [Haematococcus lacustris]